ncbi:uncharacterized protein wu:fb74b10 isoform X1 [Danio rerio]|uniref:Uncharacterized protein wu:fb74b10 isoform X1 n=3 Tax=Danio rerio TaxID=7955 RepID=A0A8M2BLE9_DANRE
MSTKGWSPEAERALVQLWQQSACLYDLSAADYHNREEKERRWREVAETLHMSTEAVATRVASLRTQYARLRKPKPGSERKPITLRQRWILRALEFLRPHIVHRRHDNTSSDKAEDTEPEPEPEPDELQEDPEREMDSFDSISVCLSPMPSTPDTGLPEECVSPRSSSSKRHRSSESDIELQKLEVLKQMSAKVLDNPPSDAAAVFASQVAMEYRLLSDPAVQMRVRRQIMSVLYEAQDAEKRQRQNKRMESRGLKTEQDAWSNNII